MVLRNIVAKQGNWYEKNLFAIGFTETEMKNHPTSSFSTYPLYELLLL
jgi:hypothetical protein